MINPELLKELNFELPNQEHVDTLMKDQSLCAELLKGDFENQCLRRVYCRTNLTLIEGVISYLKASTYQFNKSVLLTFKGLLDLYAVNLDVPFFKDVVSSSEAELLLEQRPMVSSNGSIRTKAAFLDFKTNFKFTFQMVDRIYKVSCSPDYRQIRKEWEHLQKAVKIRNRITHPKIDVSLDISDEEMDVLVQSGQWFLDFSGEVFTNIGESMDRNSIALEASTEPLVEKALADMAKLLAMHDAGEV